MDGGGEGGDVGAQCSAGSLRWASVWVVVTMLVDDEALAFAADRESEPPRRNDRSRIARRKRADARKWIDQRNAEMSPRARDQICVEVDVTDRTITVIECRPPWREDFGPEWARFSICCSG